MLLKDNGREVFFELKGQKIAAKVWGSAQATPILALHGWLDNAASFDGLGPLLEDHYIVAVDLPGHGKTYHKSLMHYLHIMDYVIDMFHLIHDVLKWPNFTLLGHSLGGAICTLMAGVYPEKINKLIVLDGLGPLTAPAEQAPLQLRRHLQETLGKSRSRVPVYSSMDAAIQARMKVNSMSEHAARLIVERGLVENVDHTFQWRTDPRLLKPSTLLLTEEQTLAFLSAITAPTLVVRPEPGLAFPESLIAERLRALASLTLHRIPGDHHVHLDDPYAVAEAINPFLAR